MKNFCASISVISEITESQDDRASQGRILYDADCQFCAQLARRFARTFRSRGFEFLPLQTPWVRQKLGIEEDAALEEMRVLTRDGRNLGGADAVIFLARRVWWARPFFLISQLPGAHRIIDSAYRWIAAHRGCNQGACQARRKWNSSLGLFLFPTLACLTRNHVPPWIFMWLTAAAIFFGCKWLTFCQVRNQVNAARAFAWFFAWPGMDAAKFFGRPCRHEAPGAKTISFTIAKIVLGVLLLFVAARNVSDPLLAGWIGMIGLILILHFGPFHLAAVGWRAAGANVAQIMNAPWRAKSLSEFWGRRWHGAFNQLALDHVFRPLTRSLGVAGATLTAFLVSGLIHESVISLPAAAGYGLPTAYFLLQGCGVVAERALPKIRGRILTNVVVITPAFWLFHPPFVRAVIIPFMKALLQLAAILQLSILTASALVPRVLDWRKNLATLHPFLRKLFWVYGVFIAMIIVAFASLTLLHADAMAEGEPAARSLCFFIASSWAARLVVQFCIFDPRPFLTNSFYKIGYHGLTVIFTALVLTYGRAAIFPSK